MSAIAVYLAALLAWKWVGILFAVLIVGTIKLLDQDEHFGQIGFGHMTMSAANAFSSVAMTRDIEPTFIVERSSGAGNNILDINIEDIFVFDLRAWNPRVSLDVDITGGELLSVAVEGGITKDNSIPQDRGPTALNVAGRVFPGGTGTSVIGAATGLGDLNRTQSDHVPEFEAYWDFMHGDNEEQTAVGYIEHRGQFTPRNPTNYTPYEASDGVVVHKLLTAAHYWMWLATQGMDSAGVLSVGGDVRKLSVDLEELLFDRETLVSLLNVLETISI